MTQRTMVQRDVSVITDDWNNEGEPDWATHLPDLPCRSWYSAGKESIDGRKEAVLEDRRVVVPLGSDVTPSDRLEGITDRRGRTLVAGPLAVQTVGRRDDHLVLTVEKVD